MPAGAARAVVIDDRGDEHDAIIAGPIWSADVEASEQLVRFTDTDGELVALPLPRRTAQSRARCAGGLPRVRGGRTG